MCLAVPAKLMDVEGANATADLHGNRIAISTLLTPDVAVGDWVLLHAGFAIQRIDAEAARRTWAVLEDLEDTIGADADGEQISEAAATSDDEPVTREPDSCDAD